MQVNKRAGEDLEHPNAKKFDTKETSVAEAALKYETEKDGNNNNNNKDGEDQNNKEIAIDSELLSHQSGSFDEASGETAPGSSGDANGKDNSEEHAQLSEQLTSYNALRHPLDSNDQPNTSATRSSDAQTQPSSSHNTTQQSPDSTTSHQSPPQPSTQILHQSSDKPLAGTEEWHRIRKDNHKEVERRRRENINSGIKELAGLLPTQDTNKSQILQRAIEYIKRLKENENNNIEKWTLEKLLTDQAVAELTASNEKLKAELERAYREVEHWKKVSSSGGK